MEKSKKLVIKTSALNQLKDEYFYLRDNISVDFAERFRLKFIELVESISPLYKRFPICKLKKPRNKNYRQIVWNSYLIVYKITEENIEVLSLFHTKQNPKKLSKLLNLNV